VLEKKERASHVDCEQPIEEGFGGGRRRRDARYPGVNEQNVDAPMPFNEAECIAAISTCKPEPKMMLGNKGASMYEPTTFGL
jgi:hypothetical protein